MSTSFLHVAGPEIPPGSIRASWNPDIGHYIVRLSEAAQLHLAAPSAREMHEQLLARMVERGDAVDHAKIVDDLVTRLDELARILEWEKRVDDAATIREILSRAGYLAETADR